MSVGKFLRRWSRLKRQRRPALPVETKALELPSLAALRRASSAQSFNATDPLDVYIDDYSQAGSMTAIAADEIVRADSSPAAEQPPAKAEEPEEPPPAPRPGEPPR